MMTVEFTFKSRLNRDGGFTYLLAGSSFIHSSFVPILTCSSPTSTSFSWVKCSKSHEIKSVHVAFYITVSCNKTKLFDFKSTHENSPFCRHTHKFFSLIFSCFVGLITLNSFSPSLEYLPKSSHFFFQFVLLFFEHKFTHNQNHHCSFF